MIRRDEQRAVSCSGRARATARLWVLALALLLALGCESDEGGGGGTNRDGSSSDSNGDVSDSGATDLSTDPGSQADGTSDGDSSTTPDGLPQITPLDVTPLNGTYVFVDEAEGQSLRLNVTNGKLYALKASFSCESPDPAAPCVYPRNVPEISCNSAYSAGYHGVMNGNTGSLNVKTDLVEAWATASDVLEGYYHLNPGKCCEETFYFRAEKKDEVLCEDVSTPDCDPYANSNCGADQHCIFNDAGLPVCAANGPTPIGGECPGLDQACAEGTCLNLGGSGPRCYRYCKIGADCGGQSCIGLADSPWKVCGLPSSNFETCDLFKQDCDADTDACYLTSLTNVPICIAEGNRGAGEACEQDNDCVGDYACHNDGTCRKICNTTQGADPRCDDVFAECISFYGNVGVCLD